MLKITGDAGEVCSKEVLESQNMIKSFVPQLTGTSSKFDSKEDQDKQQQVCMSFVGDGNGDGWGVAQLAG